MSRRRPHFPRRCRGLICNAPSGRRMLIENAYRKNNIMELIIPFFIIMFIVFIIFCGFVFVIGFIGYRIYVAFFAPEYVREYGRIMAGIRSNPSDSRLRLEARRIGKWLTKHLPLEYSEQSLANDLAAVLGTHPGAGVVRPEAGGGAGGVSGEDQGAAGIGSGAV